MRPTCASPTRRSGATSTRPSRSDTTCSPIRRSPTSPASSIRSSGSRRPTSGAGTCCWTAPRSRRRAGSTCRRGSRTSSPSPSTRCSATRRASAHCSRAFRRSTACGDRGSRRHRRRGDRPGRHGRAALRPCGLRGRHRRLPRHPGRRDRPAPSRADRHRHDLPAGRGARDLAARGAGAAAALRRRPGDPHLRARDVGPPRGHRRVELPAPGRAGRRRALRRPRSPPRTTSRSGPAASATQAPGRPRSGCRRTG